MLFGFAMLSGGCGGGWGGGGGGAPGDDEPEQQEFIEIPEEHVLLENAVFNPEIRSVPAEEIQSASYGDPDNDKMFGVAPLQVIVSSENGGYEIGDVMAAQPSDDSQYGFTAVVEGVTDNPDGTKTVTLRQALLPDVLIDGDIFFSFGKTPDEFAASYGGEEYSAGSRFAGQLSSDGARGWGNLWDLITQGISLTGELKKNIVFNEFSLENNATLKAKFFEFLGFETTAKMKTSFKIDVDACISIRNNELKKIALGFPIQATSGANISFKTKLSNKDEVPITPPLTVPSAPIPVGPCVIPTYFVLEGLLSLETGVDGKIGFSQDGVYNGGIGFWWESESGFHEMDFQKNFSFSGGPEMGEIFNEAFFDFGIGPKFSFSIGIPKAKIVSASATAGGEIKVDPDLNVNNLDAKFKAKFSVDLLTALLGLLPSSVVKTDASFSVEAKYNIFPGSEGVNPPNPPDPPNPPGVDMSWYYDNPTTTSFTINSAEQLAGLAYLVNNRIDSFYFDTITLTQNLDLDLGGKAWTPIGCKIDAVYRGFYGEFDGGGHTIANMRVAIESDSEVNAGLFGYNGGTIKNVNLSDVYVSSSSSSSYERSHAGGLVGLNSGTSENCTSSGDVSSSSSLSFDSVGGLVGWNHGTIENCKSSGDVSSSSSSSSSSYVGGLVGYNSGTIENNCTSSGDVSSSSYSYSYFSYAGGLVGLNYGTIENCTSSGDVSSFSAGGLVGENRGTIENCTSSGDVSFVSVGGGLVGYNSGTIENNCTSSGDVSSSSSDCFYSHGGGLVGENRGTIENCTSSSDVSSSSASYAVSASSSCAGGLVGYNYDGTIENCTSSGKDITATNPSDSNRAWAGGFIGLNTSYAILSGNHNNTGISPAIGRDERLTTPGPSNNI
jgi:hypothetical protein